MLLSAATALYAQTTPTNWDTSGNSLLNGSFYFRQVAYSIGDDSGDFTANMQRLVVEERLPRRRERWRCHDGDPKVTPERCPAPPPPTPPPKGCDGRHPLRAN